LSAPEKPQGHAEKRALTLADPPTYELVEVPVRRSLSQDGRTIFLTPGGPLEAGRTYHLVAEGLTNPAGETAPRVEAVFATAAVVLPPPVDFSRIRLNYPDETFNVTVTVPEGAIPPYAAMEVEAPGMGSVFTGQMNPRGDPRLTIRATLGECLRIRVQLRDGRVFEGHLSRYVSTDGRVTLGVDGGRVESADGLASATFPEGALEEPAEIRVAFVPEVPTELDPALAAFQDKILG